jgi:hypothetical protein
MAFNEKLNKLLEEIQKKKPFNYDIVFGENSEFKKQNTLLQVKLKALSMEEKDADLWWDVVQDIVQKDIGKVYKKCERNERLYIHTRFFRWKKLCHHLSMNLLFCLQNQRLQMRKKKEGIKMGQDHQIEE